MTHGEKLQVDDVTSQEMIQLNQQVYNAISFQKK